MTDPLLTRSATDRFEKLFPDSSARTAGTRWSNRRFRAVIATGIVSVVLITLLATNAFGSSGARYRTATASDQDVDALYSGVAIIEPVAQATVAFPVAGTVASVAVHMGDTVTAGTTLASLDTQSLNDTLHQKQAALAQAQLTLSKALSGQSVGTTAGSGASGSATLQSVRDRRPAIVFTAAPSTDPQLAAAQQAVVDAQHQADLALAVAETALTNEESVCASVSTTTTTTTTPPAPDDDLTACQTAISSAIDAQKAVAAAQKTLSDASNALDDLLDQRASSSSPVSPGSGGSGGAGASGSAAGGSEATSPGTAGGASSGGGSFSGGSGSFSGGSGSSGRSPSAADLASYQQAVDAAAGQVAVAQQAVAQATIASPIDGTVVAVDLSPGATVTAGSTAANVIVQGAGGYEATTTVTVDQITHIAVGDPATVIPDGSHQPLAGKVVSISAAPVPGSTSASYLVVIGLAKPDAELNNGSTGSLTVTTQHARSALAVPTSAVTTSGTRHRVVVLDGGATKQVTVQVGVVGAEWTEITSGLRSGQTVVIADASSPLPGSATSASNATTGPTPVFGGRFAGGATAAQGVGR